MIGMETVPNIINVTRFEDGVICEVSENDNIKTETYYTTKDKHKKPDPTPLLQISDTKITQHKRKDKVLCPCKLWLILSIFLNIFMYLCLIWLFNPLFMTNSTFSCENTKEDNSSWKCQWGTVPSLNKTAFHSTWPPRPILGNDIRC
nr:homolog of EHV2 ORF27 envelope glycoprotein 48 [Macronycteris gammaherpesvirus 1]